MFGLINSNKEAIAFHRERRVVERFQETYYQTNKEWLQIIHTKKKSVKKYYRDYEDLYLVRYGDTYIQSKYLYIMELDITPLLDNLYCSYDTLIRIIEMSDDNKKSKQLGKALEVINDEIERYNSTIPPLNELRDRDLFYEQYKHSKDYPYS